VEEVGAYRWWSIGLVTVQFDRNDVADTTILL